MSNRASLSLASFLVTIALCVMVWFADIDNGKWAWAFVMGGYFVGRVRELLSEN